MSMYLPNPALRPTESEAVEFLDDPRAQRQVQLPDELSPVNPAIAGDVAKISDDTWAIHGVIPVDGDVILEEFNSYDDARTVLDQLPSGSHGETDP
jgi:hypothetical protein